MVRSRFLGTSESQLPTAATKISVCLLFIPRSPAEPTQCQERSWSLFLALQGRERESLRCHCAGLGAAAFHPLTVPASLALHQGGIRAGGTAPDRDKVLLLGQVDELRRQLEGGVHQHLSRHCCKIWHAWGVAAMEVALKGGLANLLFCLDLVGGVRNLKSQLSLPLRMRALKGVEESELRATPHPMMCWIGPALPSPSHEMLLLPVPMLPSVLTFVVDDGDCGAAGHQHPTILTPHWEWREIWGDVRANPGEKWAGTVQGAEHPWLGTLRPAQCSAPLSIPAP